MQPARTPATGRRASRRILFCAAPVLAAPALLSACGAQTPARQSLAESRTPVTLAWFGKLKGIAQGDVDAFAQQYKAARPQVTLDVTSVSNTAEGKAKLATFAAAGTPVDVVSTFAGIPDLRQLNGGFSLSEYVKRDRFDATQFAQNTMRGVEVKGKLLALPHAYAGNEIALVANKTLFQRAGVPLPAADWKSSWTWPQFREALKKLTDFAGSPPVAGTARFGTIYNVPVMWGARWATDDGKTVLVDKPEMTQAWTEYYDLVLKDRSARFSPNAPAELGGENPSFLGGKAATLTICCAVPTTTVLFRDQNIDWAFLPFPKAQNAVADISAAVIAVWSQSKAPDESWRFLRWSVEEGRLANLEQRMPSQSKAIQPYVQKFYAQGPDVRADVLLHAPEYALPADALWQSPASGQADSAITAAFTDVQKGNKTVPAALAELKSPLQALLDQYRDQ
jgi:multiple sugar transport system substrate-binding protein